MANPSSAANSRTILFSDTGVQIIRVPLPRNALFPIEKVGVGWQYCRCRAGDETVEYGYLQWQIAGDFLLLAVDTTVGPNDPDAVGYFAKIDSFGGDFYQNLTGLLDLRGEPLQELPAVEFVIRPATAEGGEPKEVHLVVDFGNSRTGALLVEFRGDSAQEPLMIPLRLMNRYLPDDPEVGTELEPETSQWWFSSRSCWCTPPYLPPQKLERTVYREQKVRGTFGTKVKTVPVSVVSSPRTFEDYSMVRMGAESDALAGMIDTEGEVRIGLSSPKRYLWAHDESWLEGANWFMADPFDRYDPEHQATHVTPLKGPLLRFLPEDDSVDDLTPIYEEAPIKPRHAPRVLMVGALYELLEQAFVYANSVAYRRLTAIQRMRVIKSLTLTYPSGMIAVEREQLRKQAVKAVSIFMQTLGKNQPCTPEVELKLDEASAVQLTYMWSEIRKLGRHAKMWFSLMGRTPTVPEPETAAPEPEPTRPSARPGLSGRSIGKVRQRRIRTESAEDKGAEVRIACIDIGGGTSDLMIAKYTCSDAPGGSVVHGETLHRDGISMAGDHLVKRLLERVIVPQFAEVVGLDPSDAETLFGREIPANRAFRAKRIHWINRLFVPLAGAYLQHAVDGVIDAISHTDPEIVSPEVVQSLQDEINRIWGPGRYSVRQDLALEYNAEEFEDIADEVFGDLLFDFCESIVEHQADVVLLAGQPTKIGYLQQLVETYLPLPKSRIISMYGRYAGAWYPYQFPQSPGIIADPKSTVAVGAAIEFSARHGMLSQIRFELADLAAQHSYYWGVMTASQIYEKKILFAHASDEPGKSSGQRIELDVASQYLLIGRKRRSHDNAQASPVYLLKVLRGKQLGEIRLQASLERERNEHGEETLQLVQVEGEVDNERAVQGQNVLFDWHTLADEQYYLDTGGLDKLEL